MAERGGALILPDAPPIPRLRFRLYRGPQDIPAMAAVGRAAAAANGDTDPFSAERMRVDHENLTNSDPREDCLLAEVDGEVVAYGRVDWEDNTDGSRSYASVGFVHPGWRRRGLGRAMLGYNERRLAGVAAAQAFAGQSWLKTWAMERDVGAGVLFAARGYRHVRIYHHMVRPDLEDIRITPLPEGLEVRPVGHAHSRALFEAACEAFRDHFGGRDESEQAFIRWTQDPDFDPATVVVAFDGDEIAGAVQVTVDLEENARQGYRRGWTDPVFVRAPWRRRSLAGALLGRALVVLRDLGMTSAQLDVDSENPNQALTLYERHSFRVDRSSAEWRKPIEAEGEDARA